MKFVTWEDWAAEGWQLYPETEAGQQRAVHHDKCAATAPAKHIETILRRLEAGDYSYFHYMKFRQAKYKTKNKPTG